MAINVGQAAPDFALFDTANQEHRLSAQRGKPVVVFFFPKAFTGTCERQIAETHRDIAQYRAVGAEVFGVSTDQGPAQAAFLKLCGADSFPILSDFRHQVVNAYGIARPTGQLPNERATFVIDSAGVVRWAHVEPSPGQWIGTGAIVDALKSVAGDSK